MDNQNFKKSVFGGFNRDDVLDYVDKLTNEYKTKIDDLEVEVRKITAQKTQLQVDLEDLNKKLDLEKRDNERAQKLNVDLGKRIKMVMAENDELKSNTETSNSELEEKLKKTQESLEEKSERLLDYTRLGINAERIMKDAEEKARIVTAKAHNQSEQLLLKANDEAKETLTRAKEEAQRVRKELQEYCIRTKEEMRDIETTLANIKYKAQKEADLILNLAREKSNKIDEITKDRLGTINLEVDKHKDKLLRSKQNMIDSILSFVDDLKNIPDDLFSRIKVDDFNLGKNKDDVFDYKK